MLTKHPVEHTATNFEDIETIPASWTDLVFDQCSFFANDTASLQFNRLHLIADQDAENFQRISDTSVNSLDVSIVDTSDQRPEEIFPFVAGIQYNSLSHKYSSVFTMCASNPHHRDLLPN